jgi:MoaA/NifB/PqqE/SkfB family radical SAM enzyme
MEVRVEDDIYRVAPASILHFYERLIPPVYRSQFPSDFELAPLDWYLPPAVTTRRPIWVQGRQVRQIGSLDVEFLSDQLLESLRTGNASLLNRYPCGLKCPGCFSEDETYLDTKHLMGWRDTFAVIDEARKIGLSSIKFLGPGELFQNPDLFYILDAAEERKLPLSIFTKGAELGDDSLANQIFGGVGIDTAAKLVEKVAQYSCVRILLGFNSFEPRKQDLLTGSYSSRQSYLLEGGLFTRRGVARYTEKRNRALQNLCLHGFNDPYSGQRLSLIAAPLKLDQLHELPDMYLWAAHRNIPLVIATTMESGPKAQGLMRNNEKNDPDHCRLIELYVAVYSRAIEAGVINMSQIEKTGISAYMATAPCNQVANGLFLRLNGSVQMCPGTRSIDARFGSIHEESIIDIWERSQNHRLGPMNNNWCRAKRTGLPYRVSEAVLSRLRHKFAGPRYLPFSYPAAHDLGIPTRRP